MIKFHYLINLYSENKETEVLRAQELHRRTLGLQFKYCDWNNFSHSAIMELRLIPQEIHIYANL